MPRSARIKKGEYCTYHIVQRGNEKKEIFFNDGDRRRFIGTLSKMKEKYNFIVYAYCLMDNHVHLLINTNGSDISQIMKSINVSYVGYINKKYQRCGHLFQDRFKSEVVDSDRYLIEVSRYIHLNPVRAKMVDDAAKYPWSSYPAYIGRTKGEENLLDVSLVLNCFSNDLRRAMREYMKYVNRAGDEHAVAGEDKHPIDFDDAEDNLKKLLDYGGIVSLINDTAAKNGIKSSDVAAVKTRYKDIRNGLIKEVRRKSNLSLKEIGELFGGLSESAVSKILKQ